jgi:hypothetical protein
MTEEPVDEKQLAEDMRRAFDVLQPAAEKMLADGVTSFAIASQMLAGSLVMFTKAADGDKSKGVRWFLNMAAQHGKLQKKNAPPKDIIIDHQPKS